MGRRRQGREFALQSLYLVGMGGMSVQEAMLIVRARMKLDEKTLEFASHLAEGTDKNREKLDVRIQKTAKNWALERMASVDLNLLRLASFELLHCPETPPSVVIDEALEIAKTYSSRDSSKFINGILDKIRKSKTTKKS